MPKAKLKFYPKDYMDILKWACGKPYGKNVGPKGIAGIIESGHLSVLEHVSISVDVECSVAVLGQLTRHRHFSFTCQSARGKAFDTFIEPVNMQEFKLEHVDVGLHYLGALDEEMAMQDARYYLPQGVKTSIAMTGNARAWFEYLPKRLCNRAMPEHRKLAEMIYTELKAAMPEIFDRPFLNCKNCTEKSCKFK